MPESINVRRVIIREITCWLNCKYTTTMRQGVKRRRLSLVLYSRERRTNTPTSLPEDVMYPLRSAHFVNIREIILQKKRKKIYIIYININIERVYIYIRRINLSIYIYIDKKERES